MLAYSLFAVAHIVFNDVAACFGDNTAILCLTAFLIFVIITDKKGIIVRYLKLSERIRISVARPRVQDLNDLIKADRSRTDFYEASQDRGHTNGRK